MERFKNRLRRITRPSRSRYQYSALREEAQEIRLLTLLPGSSSDDVKILLHTTQLIRSVQPQYEALSYVWGSPKSKAEVIVGPGERQIMRITRNLAMALPYLRYEDRPRVLWIDAICINQGDMEEKSRQVERMADLYRMATRVVVWVGPEADGSDRAVELLSSLGSKVDVNWRSQTMTSSISSNEEMHWADLKISLPWEDIDCAFVLELLDQQWFERLWTQQEIQLANPGAVLQRGKSSMLWEDFRKAVYCLVSKPWGSENWAWEAIVARQDLIQMIVYELRTSSVVQLLAITRRSKASNARDKIFALLGMLDYHYGHHFGIKPDYHKTQREVYQDAFLKIALSEGLDPLTMCETSGDSEDTHPTWVPDWSARKETRGLYNAPLYGGESLAEMLHIPGVPDVLSIVGTPCSSVSQVIDVSLDSRDLSDIVTSIQSIIKLLGNLEGPYVSGGILFEAFCRTTCCDDFEERWDPPSGPSPSLAQGPTALQHVVDYQGDAALLAKDVLEPPDDVKYWNIALSFSRGRRFFITEQGFIGLGPAFAQIGDIVADILGCSSLMMLRPDGNFFKVVGECYVCGLSDSEAFFGPVPTPYFPVISGKTDTGWIRGFRNTETGQIQETDPRLPQIIIPEKQTETLYLGPASSLQADDVHAVFLDSSEHQHHEAEINEHADMGRSFRTNHDSAKELPNPQCTGLIGGHRPSGLGASCGNTSCPTALAQGQLIRCIRRRP